METLLITLLVVSVIGFVGSLVLSTSIANSTGKNLYSGFFRKLLMAVGGIGIMGFMSVGEMEGALPLALLMSIGALVVLFLLNMKKEVSIVKVIILSILETLSGFVMVLAWGLGIILKMFSGGSFASLDFDSKIKKAAQEHNEMLEARRKEHREEHARSLGFDSPEEAEGLGLGIKGDI